MLLNFRLFSAFKKVARIPKRPLLNFSSFRSSHRNSQDNNDTVPFDFTDDNYTEIQKILKKYPENYKKSAVIPLLTLAQKQENNFLSLTAMKKVAKILEIPEIDVFEVASFYTMFNREKVGKYHLQVCGTTPCRLCGCESIIKAIEESANVEMGKTSADGLFTLQEVECLGACANAPMLQINGEWVYEDLTPENTKELINKLKKGEKLKIGPQTNRKNAEGPQGRTTLKNFKDSKFDRDFEKEKVDYKNAKEQERIEAEKKKQAAQK